MSPNQPRFKVRVGFVLIQDNAILLARQNNHPFWVLPGGTLERGETMADCARREMQEETGLDVRIGPLLCIADFIAADRHVIDTVFLADRPMGDLCMETTENLNALRYVTCDELKTLSVRPEPVFKTIMTLWDSGFKDAVSTVYLGKYPT